MAGPERGKSVELADHGDGQRIDHRWLDAAAARLADAERITLPAARFKELLTLARRSLGPRRVGPEEEKRESTF